MQSRRVRGAAGEPLPTVFRSLEQAEIRFLRGQFVLVVAGPGTGKSAFVLTEAVESGVSCLYFSADSDAFVQLSRMYAMRTGSTMAAATRAVLNDDLGEFAAAVEYSPIRFIYDASPTLDRIEAGVRAYLDLFGEFPALIVADNITNVVAGGVNDDDPFAGLEGLSDFLGSMARDTQACVIGLHHVTGPYVDAGKPIPLSGVKGQVTRVPAQVLTLHRPTADELCVSQVKARGAKADSTGSTYAVLDFDGERMRISDPSYTRTERHDT